jgi:predicted glycoside hydrolase/deacetylase ChbG (UPF0249 family)
MGSDETRTLIVNADDFGRTRSINAGVIRAHEDGIVTSASMMVLWPAAEEASQAVAGSHAALALGLHLDLAEWRPAGEDWNAVYERVPGDDAQAMEAEARRQLERFRELTGRDPSHLDSHQHAHNHEPLATIAAELGAELGVPVRATNPEIAYCGSFYGQGRIGEPLPEAITADHLVRLIQELPAGVTELGCHPGIGVGPSESSYNREREQEVAALCHPLVSDAIRREGVELRSFADLSA